MITRGANKADIKLIKNMWENSRGESVFSRWFFDKVFYSENAVITEENEQPMAAACTLDYDMMINKSVVSAGYIGAFLANPENKTREVMNTLAADTLGFLLGKGKVIAFAVPEDYKFYQKHGFALCYDYKQYDITASDLPDYGIKGAILRPKACDDEVLAMLNAVYTKFTEKKNGYTLRRKENWRLIFEDLHQNFNGKCVIYKNNSGNVLGYMFYIIRDGKMGIYELAYSEREGYEGLISFIKAHDTNVLKVSMKVPGDDLSYLSFCDNRRAMRLCPFAMARITDVRKILKLYAENAPENLRLQVIDRIMEENNKTFTFTEGDAIVIETDANVTTDIGTLTQLVLGYLSVSEAAELNLIKGDAGVLEKLFKKQNTYVNMLNI